MSNVTIKLVDTSKFADFFFTNNAKDLAKTLMAEGKYTRAGDFFFNQEGEAAAEEAFEMTNNPSRQYEREKYYGRGRSVSVGDIVEVDGVNFLCLGCGWVEL